MSYILDSIQVNDSVKTSFKKLLSSQMSQQIFQYTKVFECEAGCSVRRLQRHNSTLTTIYDHRCLWSLNLGLGNAVMY